MNGAPAPTPIYRGATALFRRNIQFLLPIALIELGAQAAILPDASIVYSASYLLVSFWLWIWVAHSGYISINEGVQLSLISMFSRRNHPSLAFWMLSIFGLAVFLVLCMFPLFMVASMREPSPVALLIISLPGLLYIGLLSQFGAAFPAAAIERKLRLRWGFGAARSHWPRLLFDLARGVLACNLVLLLFFWLGPRFGLQTEPRSDLGAIEPIGLVVTFVGALLGSWTTYLSVIALNNAYRIATARPDVSRVFE